MKAIVTGLSLLVLNLLAAPQLAIADISGQSSTASDATVSINDSRKFDPSSATILDDSLALAALSGDNGTLTVGLGVWGGCRPAINVIYGFVSSRGIGSYSATGLTGGKTVLALYDTTGSCVGNFSNLSISGFSSDPGKGWLSSITCNGITNNGTGTFRYLYGNGTATWEWSQLFSLASKRGSNVSCTIVHN